MTEFTIQPCKLRDGFIVSQKNAERWKGGLKTLFSTFFFDVPLSDMAHLKGITKNCYIGKIKNKRDAGISLFVFRNQDWSNNVKWLVRSDKTFESRLKEIFFVEDIIRKGEIIEKKK